MDSLFTYVVLTVAMFGAIFITLIKGIKEKKFHVNSQKKLWTTWADSNKY